jgi:hypothetical protein
MDQSTAALALATAGLVPAVYSAALPNLAEVRGQADDRGHLAAGERYAALVAGAVVLGVAGATRSPVAAAAGLVSLIAFSAAYRAAAVAQP